jgi:hypothetical protein
LEKLDSQIAFSFPLIQKTIHIVSLFRQRSLWIVNRSLDNFPILFVYTMIMQPVLLLSFSLTVPHFAFCLNVIVC